MNAQHFDDVYSLGKVRSKEELSQHIFRLTALLFTCGIGLAIMGAILYEELHGYFKVSMILWMIGACLIFIGAVIVESGCSASREQIAEIVNDMRGLSQIESLFCAHMEIRDFLTVDEYHRFQLAIEHEKEKRSNVELNEAIQSMCRKTHETKMR